MKTLKFAVLLAALPLAAAAQDPVKVDGGHYKLLVDNASVRVLKISYAPGAKSVMHSPPDAMLVPLGAAKVRFTLADGKTRLLSSTQTIQRRLADMCRRITTAQLLSLQLGRMKDQETMHHAQVSLAKWNNVRMALDVARDARDILGAAGISIEFHSIRHMMNLESVITYEGTETVHELVVGRELTGISAF